MSERAEGLAGDFTTEFIWPSVDEIVSVLKQWMAQSDEVLVVSRPDELNNLLGRAKNFEAYESADIAMIAAILLNSAAQHVLKDGNKRLAFLTAISFLKMNGHYLDMPELGENSAYELSMQLVTNDADLTSGAETIRRHLVN